MMVKRFSLKMEIRRRKVIEMHVAGSTIPEIVQHLNSEYPAIIASERTVWEDLHSEMAEDYLSPFAKELIRKQNAAIEACTNEKVKLRYRDRLIGKVLPRREIIKTEIKQEIIEAQDAAKIRDFSEEEREEIRKAGRILLNKRPGEAGPSDLQ